ncbi:MAG: hypothetical protein ABH827_01175 [bacterium]
MLIKKRTYIFIYLFLSMSFGMCAQLEQQIILSGVNVSEDNLGKMSEEIEQIVQAYASDQAIEKYEALGQKYTEQEFIDSVLYPDKKRLEELKAFGDSLIVEIPVQEWFGDSVPRIGVYNKDLFELLFAGAGWALDHYLYKKLQTYFVDVITQRIIVARDKLLPLLAASSQPLANAESSGDQKPRICCSEFDSQVSQEVTLGMAGFGLNNPDILLEAELRNLAHMRWADLIDQRFCNPFATYFVADIITQALRYRWLSSEKDRVGLFGFLHKVVQNASGLQPQSLQGEPIALSSLVDVPWLFQLPVNNATTNVLETVNSFLVQYGFFDTQMSRFLRHKAINFVRQVTVNMLFVAWFNHYIMSVICSRSIVKYKDEFKELLLAQRDQDDNAQENLREFVQETCGMSCGLWKELRNQKLAEWQLYYNVLVMVPMCYKIGQIAYKIYVASDVQNENKIVCNVDKVSR